MTREEAAKMIKDDIRLHHDDLSGKYRHALNIAIEALQQPEIIRCEERKAGEWIKMSDCDGIYWACSECGEDIPRAPHYNPQFDLFPRLKSIEKTNYCPNCGADMRETT